MGAMRLFRLFPLLLLPLCPPLHAQDAPPAEPPAEAPATVDPAVPLKKLELQLVPKTITELEADATAWRDLLQTKAAEIAEAKIANIDGEGPDSAAMDQLATEQKQIGDRLKAVLKAIEAKGGDPAELQAYLTAVRGADIQVDNPSGVLAAFRRWLEAEDGARSWIVRVAVFLAIVIVGAILAGLLSGLASKAMKRHKRSSALLDRFVSTIVRRGVLLIALVIALSTMGVEVGALVALIGGGAFIIGFALQDSLGNFANGIMLMLYRPFEVGDAVEIGGVSGSVDSVSLVNTTIRSWDNKVIIVPNKNVWGQTITNITGADRRRVDMVFGIGYDDDIDKAQAVLEKIVAEQELVLEDPAPTIKMHELADSSVNFVCRPWAKTSDYWAVYWDVTRQVKQAFDAEGISIPYPQRDVHLHQAG